jgi:hypothetical protein
MSSPILQQNSIQSRTACCADSHGELREQIAHLKAKSRAPASSHKPRWTLSTRSRLITIDCGPAHHRLLDAHRYLHAQTMRDAEGV